MGSVNPASYGLIGAPGADVLSPVEGAPKHVGNPAWPPTVRTGHRRSRAPVGQVDLVNPSSYGLIGAPGANVLSPAEGAPRHVGNPAWPPSVRAGHQRIRAPVGQVKLATACGVNGTHGAAALSPAARASGRGQDPAFASLAERAGKPTANPAGRKPVSAHGQGGASGADAL